MKKGMLWGMLCPLLLSGGCGFHLRGSHDAWGPLPVTALEGAAQPLQAEMKSLLEDSGTPIVADQKQAKLIVKLLEEHVDQRILSVAPTGKVEEYEIHYVASYTAQDSKGQVLIAPEAVEQIRSYPYSDLEVLGAAGQNAYLVTDMRRGAAEQIMRRLEVVMHKSPALTP